MFFRVFLPSLCISFFQSLTIPSGFREKTGQVRPEGDEEGEIGGNLGFLQREREEREEEREEEKGGVFLLMNNINGEFIICFIAGSQLNVIACMDVIFFSSSIFFFLIQSVCIG